MTKGRITLLIVTVIAVIGIGGYWFIAIPATSSPNGSVSQSRFAPGPYEVVSESFTAVDESRTTQAYKAFPGLPNRTLDGEIWRPKNRVQPGPLLINSHGFMSFRQEGLYLNRFLASHGYTVVAVDYPLTGIWAPEGPLMTDVINQPGDVSFLIDTILRRNANNADTLYNTIDPEKIAVAGVSLGGLTSILATFHPKLQDPRIAALVSIAGPTSIFTPTFFESRDLPFLMVYGGGDAIVPHEDNALPVLSMYPDVTLVTLADASHAGFAQPASTLMRFNKNPDDVGCRTVTEELGVEVAEQNDEFMTLLGDADDGIDLNQHIEFCTRELIPEAMKASRQHMFTTLAVHAFLDSLFAEDDAARSASREYLQTTLAQENGSEVSVTQPDQAG
jgi:predicted dienelactone hydrolase